ncbi:hypothetical protein [Aquimarina sp. 2304DJ70-9]|uniref:hypothetical protein n=1 Tax=Aquimarina penaris TaxID=3231044 RepID=UPI003462DC40
MAERNYSFKDTVLLEWGDTTVEHLKLDIDQFTTFDPKLNNDFVTQLEQKVAQGYKEGGDDLNVAQLQEKTEVVEKAMQECRTYFKKLRYWVLDAFPGQKAIQRQFGIGRFKDVTKNQIKMIQFMEGLSDTIAQHLKALEATGMPKDIVKQPTVLAQTLREVNKVQEQKKGTRTVDTAERVEQLNELYAILQKINAAADNVFDEFTAKRDLYRAPNRSGGVTVGDEQEEELV